MSDERMSGVGGRGSEHGNDATAATMLAASNNPANAAGSAPTPDPRDATPWPLLYGAVLVELALLIVLFYAFTKAFA
jgi:hypothetical protein